jgi:PAS domain S-box-containing protein
MGEASPEGRRTHARRDAATVSSETEPLTAGQFPRSVCSRIIDANQLATITTDRHGTVAHWDRMCEQMFGWSQVQATGTDLGELLSVTPVKDEDAEQSECGIIARVSKVGSWSGSVVSRCTEGSPVPVLVAASCLTSPKGKVTGYVVMCTPTSDDQPSRMSHPFHVPSEDPAATRAREMFFRVFLDSPVGTALVGVDGYIVDVNHALGRSLGLARDELVGENFIKFTHPEDRDLEFDYAQRLFDGKIDRFQIDRRFTRADGSTMTGRITASTVRDPGGVVLFGIGVVEDVTERLRAEKAHLESETVFRRTIEASNDAFVGMDSSGRVTDWNAAAESLFGWAGWSCPKSMRARTANRSWRLWQLECRTVQSGRRWRRSSRTARVVSSL